MSNTLGTDTFVRADQSGWGTASDSNTYTNTGGGTVAIASNHGTISNAGLDTNMQHGTYTSISLDVLVRVTPTNTGDIFGPEARYSVSGGNATCYKFLAYSGAIHINKAISGANSQLTSVNFTITANQAYWMRLRTIGSTIVGDIWLDGSNESTATSTSVTDTSISTAGGAALLGNTATTNVIKYDSLTVTDGSSSRTVPASAALQSTLTRTIPASAALQRTSQRTIPASAALQSTVTRTIPASAALQSLGLQRSIPATVALQSTRQRVIPATASLSAPTSSRIIPATVALQTTSTRIIPATVALVEVNVKLYVRGGEAVAYVRHGQATLYVRKE